MRKLITSITLAATIGAGTLAATLPASASVNWRAQTCQAASAYQRHPSAGSLATLVTGSTHLPRGYLKADVGQLYADASSPSVKAAKYVAKDEGWIADDCKAW
jgi:hypothetical protein